MRDIVERSKSKKERAVGEDGNDDWDYGRVWRKIRKGAGTKRGTTDPETGSYKKRKQSKGELQIQRRAAIKRHSKAKGNNRPILRQLQ